MGGGSKQDVNRFLNEAMGCAPARSRLLTSFLEENFLEIKALREQYDITWTSFTASLVSAGVVDGKHKPPNENAVRLAWYRTRRRYDGDLAASLDQPVRQETDIVSSCGFAPSHDNPPNSDPRFAALTAWHSNPFLPLPYCEECEEKDFARFQPCSSPAIWKFNPEDPALIALRLERFLKQCMTEWKIEPAPHEEDNSYARFSAWQATIAATPDIPLKEQLLGWVKRDKSYWNRLGQLCSLACASSGSYIKARREEMEEQYGRLDSDGKPLRSRDDTLATQEVALSECVQAMNFERIMFERREGPTVSYFLFDRDTAVDEEASKRNEHRSVFLERERRCFSEIGRVLFSPDGPGMRRQRARVGIRCGTACEIGSD